VADAFRSLAERGVNVVLCADSENTKRALQDFPIIVPDNPRVPSEVLIVSENA
jgi:hypothetical protein